MSVNTFSEYLGIKKVFLDCNADDVINRKSSLTLSFLSDETKLPLDWISLKIGISIIWIHFKKIALVDGLYLYVADQVSLIKPAELKES